MNICEEWIERIKTKENVYIYGAGIVGTRLVNFCKDNDIVINGIIVADKEGNPDAIGGISVFALQELAAKIETIDLFIALNGNANKWIDYFDNSEFHTISFLSKSFQAYLRDNYNKKNIEKSNTIELGAEYIIDMSYETAEINHAVLIDKRDNNSICRMIMLDATEHADDLIERINNDELEGMFGKIKKLPYKGKREKRGEILDDNTEIYIVTSHMDNMDPELEMELYSVPIQVGTYFADYKKKCIQDDQGINISNKNRNYCECTALYWMWKNLKGKEYIGLEHYRRRLGIDSNSYERIRLDRIDFVSVIPEYTFLNIHDFFMTWLSEKDWDLMIEGIILANKEMAKTVKKYEHGHFFIPCNMGLWSEEWFEKYCQFAFEVADYIEAYYEKKHLFREDRYMGYIFENLYSVFIAFYHEQMKIVFADLEWISV